MSNNLQQAVAALAANYNIISADTALHVIDLIDDTDHEPFVDALLDAASTVDILRAIADAIGVDYVDLNGRDLNMSVNDDMVAQIGLDYLSTHGIIPMTHADGSTVVVAANPEDTESLAYIRSRAGNVDRVVMAAQQQVNALLLVAASMATAEINAGPQAVPQWIDALLVQALAQHASDIHFRFQSDGRLLTRVRVDGVLRKVKVPDAILSRETEVIAAILARCDTLDGSNLREPQDGAFSFEAAGGKTTEVRVALLPQVAGPNLTLRLLDADAVRRTPEAMGIRDDYIAALRDIIHSPAGALIVTGPTGSGKSTTLFALLAEVDAVSRNCLSVEDPVEYHLPNVGQTAIRHDLGNRSMTWARALRSILRSDPDVVLVGEIRDPDVAKTALEASSTGHLVLTTLHANSAPGAFSRLTQMGLKPHEIADAVTAVVAQRLIRTLCNCAVDDRPTAEETELFTEFNMDVPATVRRATGCTSCAGTGYAGRRVVLELLIPTAEFRDVVTVPGVSSSRIDEAAAAAGWLPMGYDALRLVADGATTIDEARRITGLQTVGDTADWELPTIDFGFDG